MCELKALRLKRDRSRKREKDRQSERERVKAPEEITRTNKKVRLVFFQSSSERASERA